MIVPPKLAAIGIAKYQCCFLNQELQVSLFQNTTGTIVIDTQHHALIHLSMQTFCIISCKPYWNWNNCSHSIHISLNKIIGQPCFLIKYVQMQIFFFVR